MTTPIPDGWHSVIHVKYWESIANNLSKAGWSWGCVSAIDSNGRTIWIADAHQGDEKRCLKKERERKRHPPALPLRRAILPPKAAPRSIP